MAERLYQSEGLRLPDSPAGRLPLASRSVGYEWLVTGLGRPTGLAAEAAAVLLNLLLLGGCLLWLRRAVPERAWFVALIFGSFSLVEVFAYPRPESAFLFGVLWLSTVLTRYLAAEGGRSRLLSLLAAVLWLFLMRPTGLFAVGVLEVAGAYLFLAGRPQPALQLWGLALVALLMVGVYLYASLPALGYITGPSRAASALPLGHLLQQLLITLTDEFFVMAAYAPTRSYALAVGAQLLLMAAAAWRAQAARPWPAFRPTDGLAVVWLVTGIIYLLVLLVLRWQYATEPLDFRSLSPFTLLVGLALLHYMASPARPVLYARVRPFVMALFVLSLASAAWPRTWSLASGSGVGLYAQLNAVGRAPQLVGAASGHVEGLVGRVEQEVCCPSRWADNAHFERASQGHQHLRYGQCRTADIFAARGHVPAYLTHGKGQVTHHLGDGEQASGGVPHGLQRHQVGNFRTRRIGQHKTEFNP